MSLPSGFWLVTKMPTFIALSLVRGSGQQAAPAGHRFASRDG
jgi:hypothetical protein